jgi:predicted nucleic acid-binding protein
MASTDRVFFDTNVLLDVLCRREAFFADSAAVWSLAEGGEIRGFVSAISFTNIFYVLRKLAGRADAERALRLIRDSFDIAPCDQRIIGQAMSSGFDDFEDAVQYVSALRSDSAYLLTRNPDHFPENAVKVLSPAEYCSIRNH